MVVRPDVESSFQVLRRPARHFGYLRGPVSACVLLILIHGPRIGEKKDFEVYSCHVSPDGSRLVTAAGGERAHMTGSDIYRRPLFTMTPNSGLDGHVRIWSTDAIFNAADPEYSKPKQLASMSYHSGTIHTVRFSPNGRYVASGADDKIVCVYTLDPTPPSHTSTFGTVAIRTR